MEIVLNFINNTDNTRNARYVLFKKNLAAENQSHITVLKYFDEIGFGESASFILKDEIWVSGWWRYEDNNGFSTISYDAVPEPMAALPGDRRKLLLHPISDGLFDISVQDGGYAGNRHEVEIVNSAESPQAIYGVVYQGRTVGSATKEGDTWVINMYKPSELFASALLEPGQKASFRFDDNLCLGVTWHQSKYTSEPGNKIIPIEEVYHITEIPLLGISSADIVATGGGPDDQRLPVNFGLSNVCRT